MPNAYFTSTETLLLFQGSRTFTIAHECVHRTLWLLQRHSASLWLLPVPQGSWVAFGTCRPPPDSCSPRTILDASAVSWKNVWGSWYAVNSACGPWSTDWMSVTVSGGKSTTLTVSYMQPMCPEVLELCLKSDECWIGSCPLCVFCTVQ